MLLSRKRGREALPPTPVMRRRASSDLRPHIDEKWFLRDLLDAYGTTTTAISGTSGTACTHENDQRSYARRQVVEFLQRHNRIPEHVVVENGVLDQSLQLSRARMSSQELFLSVVLEWQRSESHTLVHQTQADARTTYSSLAAHTRAASNTRRSYYAAPSSQPQSSESDASSSSDASSDSELEAIHAHHSKRQRQFAKSGDDVSPTSVHNVPRNLTPLNLDYIPAATAAPTMKRIGIYSPRARQELLRKYMAKREKRLSQHKVRYRVRKTLANARPRVKGRFVKTEQPLTAALAESMGGSE